MAKEDFCFTYYDGDACRDMSHMNRLERGAYNDIVLQQRKFGRLTLDQIKKVLGKDFDECWASVSLVLVLDGEKYYLEWLERSILQMRAHAKKQSENKKGKTKDKPDNNQTESKQEPNTNQTNPLKDGDGDGDESGYELKNKKELDFSKPDIAGDEIVFPIDSKPARDLWAGWKKSRWTNHNARYGMMGEQAALKRLQGMTFAQMEETILAAIAGEWKNLYPKKNGTSKTSQRSEASNSRIEGFKKRHGTGAGNQ